MVGNFDFNESPVFHLDLDFDLGFVKNNDMGGGACKEFSLSSKKLEPNENFATNIFIDEPDFMREFFASSFNLNHIQARH